MWAQYRATQRQAGKQTCSTPIGSITKASALNAHSHWLLCSGQSCDVHQQGSRNMQHSSRCSYLPFVISIPACCHLIKYHRKTELYLCLMRFHKVDGFRIQVCRISLPAHIVMPRRMPNVAHIIGLMLWC